MGVCGERMGMIIIITYCGAARGTSILGIAAPVSTSTMAGAMTSATMLVFESVAGLGGLSPLSFFPFSPLLFLKIFF